MRTGLVRHNRSLAYGVRHGFGYYWLPERVQRIIVRVVNRISCRLWGHDDLMWHVAQSELSSHPECVQCCEVLYECAKPEEHNAQPTFHRKP